MKRGGDVIPEISVMIWSARLPGRWPIHCHLPHHTTNNNVEEKGGGGLVMVIDVTI